MLSPPCFIKTKSVPKQIDFSEEKEEDESTQARSAYKMGYYFNNV